MNGGLAAREEGHRHLEVVDGVMFGRAAYQTPYLLAGVDAEFFGSDQSCPSREDVLEHLLDYAGEHVRNGGRLNNITRHILGLYHGQPGARAFRRYLSENAVGPDAGIEVLRRVIAAMRARRRPPMAAAE